MYEDKEKEERLRQEMRERQEMIENRKTIPPAPKPINKVRVEKELTPHEQIKQAVESRNNNYDDDYDDEYEDDDEYYESDPLKIAITLTVISLLLFGGYKALTLTTLYESMSKIIDIGMLVAIGIMALIFVIYEISSIDDNKMKLTTVAYTFAIVCFGLMLSMVGLKPLPEPIIEEANLLNMHLGQKLSSFDKYADKNNITYETNYIFNDAVPKEVIYGIQKPTGKALGDNGTKVIVYVSNGENPDKTVELPNLVGMTVQEAKAIVEKLRLTNYRFEFKVDKNSEDKVLAQSIKGDMKKDDELLITASMGMSATEFVVELIDFKGKTQAEMEAWMKKHNIQYTIVLEKSDTIEKGIVMSQTSPSGTKVHPGTKNLKVTVSSGKEIKTISFTGMTLTEAKKWIEDNGLKVEIVEMYDDTAASGMVIGSNKYVGTVMEAGETIKLTVSKGQLKFVENTNLGEFRNWASQYGVNYKETFEFSDTVANGGIIRFSHKNGDVVKNNDTITVYISQGKQVTIPSFIGKTKDEIVTMCSGILTCEFEYAASSNVAKDTAIGQSKDSGSAVVNGTRVVITLSPGPAPEMSLVIQEGWLSIGNADRTIESLRTELGKSYPTVTFNFVKRAHNTLNSGMIHPDSPVTTGSKIKAGETYEIIIVE